MRSGIGRRSSDGCAIETATRGVKPAWVSLVGAVRSAKSGSRKPNGDSAAGDSTLSARLLSQPEAHHAVVWRGTPARTKGRARTCGWWNSYAGTQPAHKRTHLTTHPQVAKSRDDEVE